MNKVQANEIIFQELTRFYKLCKYIPSPANWMQFLETLDHDTAVKLDAEYTWETAWKHLFIYTHWYVQTHHKSEIDEIMKSALLPEVYQHYKIRYKPNS
jgi:hypothetical protein